MIHVYAALVQRNYQNFCQKSKNICKMAFINNTWKIFACFSILASILQAKASIKCFVCSYPEKRCGDLFGYTTPDAYECSPGIVACFKRRGFRDNGQGTKVVEVYRGCSSDNAGNTCKSSTYNNINVEECLCTTDYCNGSINIHNSYNTLIICSILFFYLIKLIFSSV